MKASHVIMIALSVCAVGGILCATEYFFAGYMIFIVGGTGVWMALCSTIPFNRTNQSGSEINISNCIDNNSSGKVNESVFVRKEFSNGNAIEGNYTRNVN